MNGWRRSNGSTMIKASDCDIRAISRQEAVRTVVQHHYLHRRPPCETAFGMFHGQKLVGVVCYGTPSSAPLRSGICGKDEANNVTELTRLWISDEVGKNAESILIGRTLPMCGKEIVVSFADPSAGHVGTVYQATNWIYTGLSAKRTNWTFDGNAKHGQTVADKYTAEQARSLPGFRLEPRQQKHRYIYFNTRSKRRKRELAQLLAYRVLPYPKTAI
jgi:hypothetical protein